MPYEEKNHFHSFDGVLLTDNPISFHLDIDNKNTFSIFIDIECELSILTNRALIQFEFSSPPDNLAQFGLIFSHHGWWYRYLPTRPGMSTVHFELSSETVFSGSLRLHVRSWAGNDTIRMKSCAAVTNPPVDSLIKYHTASRDIDRYRTKRWRSLNALLDADTLEAGAHVVPTGNLLIDFHISDRRGSTLLCFLHGNAPRSDLFKLPVFSGFHMTEGIDSSTLTFSDPCLLLDPELKIAWHAGTLSTPVQYFYELIIRKVLSIFGTQKLIFWGGSGGGFASLYFSSRFARSLAFVWNPQTSIRAFDPDDVSRFTRICYGCDDRNKLDELLTDRAIGDLAPLYAGARPPSNHVVLLQNITDPQTASHIEPFLRKIGVPRPLDREYRGWLTPNLYLYLADFAPGHTPPPRPVIHAFLKEMVMHGIANLDSFTPPATGGDA